VAENNTNKNFKTNCKPLDYLWQAFNHPFPSIQYHAVMTSEISEIRSHDPSLLLHDPVFTA
jgi:hypothetical protein